VKSLLEACREHGIHTAVETNLNIERIALEDFIPLVDLWMCDFKLAGTELHRKWTGAGNRNTVRNLGLLLSRRLPVVVRTTVVPGVNDNENEIGRIAAVLSKMGEPLAYELQAFHTLGFDKFAPLGMKNPMAGTGRFDVEAITRLKTVIRQYGLKTEL
jgi:pyruvate formate lyase activating enzyme